MRDPFTFPMRFNCAETKGIRERLQTKVLNPRVAPELMPDLARLYLIIEPEQRVELGKTDVGILLDILPEDSSAHAKLLYAEQQLELQLEHWRLEKDTAAPGF